MTSLTLLFNGGALHGRYARFHYDREPPVEVRVALGDTNPVKPEKMPCQIYRVTNVQKADKPLRGMAGNAVFLRETEAVPGLVFRE